MGTSSSPQTRSVTFPLLCILTFAVVTTLCNPFSSEPAASSERCQLRYSVRQVYPISQELYNLVKQRQWDKPRRAGKPAAASQLLGCTSADLAETAALKHCEGYSQDVHQWPSISSSPRELCSDTNLTAGCWVDQRTLRLRFTPAQLGASWVRGDVASALLWRKLWLPSTCAYYRYNMSSVYRCTQRFREASVNHTAMWIYFLGDSTTAGLYCGFLRLLQGDEMNGALPTGPCYERMADGRISTASLTTGEQEFTYACDPNGLKVSWHYTYEMGSRKMLKVLRYLMELPVEARPTHIIYNSGAFDYDRFARILTKPEIFKNPRQIAQARKGLQSQHTIREKELTSVLDTLREGNFRGRFFYRNNPCNIRFYARLADSGVEERVRAAGWEVVDAYSMSVGRGVDLLSEDGLHFARSEGFSKDQWEYRPHVGELNIQVLQTFVNMLCNRYISS